MTFGLESFLLPQPFSAITSLIILLGFYQIGKFLFRINIVKDLLKNKSHLNYQYISLSIFLISLLIYPLTLFFKIDYKIFFLISLFIFFLGIYYVLNKIFFYKKFKKIFEKKINKYETILLIIILGYFLLALAPITDSDSLDYHLSVPIFIINKGYFPKDLNWFHSAQAGIGEIPIIFGLILGAQQSASLIQFSGLLSIFGIINKNISKQKNNDVFYLILLFLSIPVLIFLNATAKPQLLLISFTTLAFVLTFFENNIKSGKIFYFKFIFVSLLLYVSFEGKFSFILSAAIIWVTLFYKSINKNNYINLFFVIFCLILIISPSLYWKFLVYEGNFINKIYFPLFQIIEGYDQFYKSLNDCEVPCNNTLFLIPVSFGRYTESIGIAILSLLFIFFIRIENKNSIIISVYFYLIISFVFGKFSPRFFLEPVLWSIIAIKYSGLSFNSNYFSLFKLLLLAQSFVTFLSILFGVFTLSIGSLNKSLNKFTLENKANGYTLSKWVNSKLPIDKKILYSHRSISFINNEIISIDFLNYTAAGDARKTYLNILKEKKPEFLVIQSNSPVSYKKLISCTNGILEKKENYFKNTSRNIFNKNNKKYSSYIYFFDYQKLPDCYFK